MTFSADLKSFGIVVSSRSNAVAAGMVAAVHESITVGSVATGAPGQPVDTGYLRGSWIPVVNPDGSGGSVSTPAAYAPVIEHGGDRSKFDPAGTKRPVDPNREPGSTPRSRKSTVGGAHSVKLTVAGADALQRDVVDRLGVR